MAGRQQHLEEEEWLADSSIWRRREPGSQQHVDEDGWLTDSRFVEKVRLWLTAMGGKRMVDRQQQFEEEGRQEHLEEEGWLANSSIFMHLEEEGKDCSQPHQGEEELLKRQLEEKGWKTAAPEEKG
jgi:hypothetical protein